MTHSREEVRTETGFILAMIGAILVASIGIARLIDMLPGSP